MKINEVVTYLGAWEAMQDEHPTVLADIERVLDSLAPETFRQKTSDSSRKAPLVLSPTLLFEAMRKEFANRKWDISRSLQKTRKLEIRLHSIDFAIRRIGVEFAFGKQASAIYSLFITFPAFVLAGEIELAVMLCPMRHLALQMPAGVSKFESLKSLLLELHPMPLRYPFAICGFSAQRDELSITQLSTKLDEYLVRKVGMSLEEVLLFGERANYDFKISLPENSKLAREVCGFANLNGGGLMMIGVSDDGKLLGIPRVELDSLQLKLTSVVRDYCNPTPTFEFQSFDVPKQDDKAVLVMHVSELETKPCMAQDRVYVRTGPSVRPAKSDEIRRLVLSASIPKKEPNRPSTLTKSP